MIASINEQVAVYFVFSLDGAKRIPLFIKWKHKYLKVKSVGFHHYFKEGKKLFHVYELVTDTNVFMRLKLDTQSLIWTLEKVSDGQAE